MMLVMFAMDNEQFAMAHSRIAIRPAAGGEMDVQTLVLKVVRW